jgi:hypothetical protein
MKYTIFVSLFAGAAAFAPIAHKTSSPAVPPFVTTSTTPVSSVADPKISSTALNMGIMDFWNAFNPYIMIVGFGASVASIFGYLDKRFDSTDKKN